MARITSVKDLSQLNKQLERIEALQKQLNAAQQQIASVHTRLTSIENTHVPSRSNTVVFTWTGSTHTLSWPAGSVVDRAGVNVAVAAGSITSLTASTYYWLAWNAVHQQMAIAVNVNTLLNIPGNIVICQLFTGTGSQTGVAGGGGSQSASDLTETRYKLF